MRYSLKVNTVVQFIIVEVPKLVQYVTSAGQSLCMDWDSQVEPEYIVLSMKVG
jgi:hypothetical protein